MKCLLQRVARASVTVDEEVVGQIQGGLLVLVGVEPEDMAQTVSRMAERLLKYRVFSDSEGRMNLNVEQAGGAILLVSQFTLAADTTSGNRPGFSTAAPPEQASRVPPEMMHTAVNTKLQAQVGEMARQALTNRAELEDDFDACILKT